MNIVAKNKNSYLSSGDIPNPQLYFGLAVLFFVTAVVWVYMIKTTKFVQLFKKSFRKKLIN